MYKEMNKDDKNTQTISPEKFPRESCYPVNLSLCLAIESDSIDTKGFFYNDASSQHDPTFIALHALAHWNQYLITEEPYHRHEFLAQAQWFIENEVSLGENASSWLCVLLQQKIREGNSRLSATTQGCVLSVVVRAYQCTGDATFLALAHRTVRTFERDILDGGISTPIGEHGTFFEEMAAYPASHSLLGSLFALQGLYDYAQIIDSVYVQECIEKGCLTLHAVIDEFDNGFWTRYDLLHRHLSTPSQLVAQTELLEALAIGTGCEHCTRVALRWKHYQHSRRSRILYKGIQWYNSHARLLWKRIQTTLFPESQEASVLRVCVPIHAFPVTGGTRAVLASVAQVTKAEWQIEYLTQHVGPNPDDLTIYKFGTAKTGPWQFPAVWLYFLTGLWKLTSLLHQGKRYQVILPQDGVFTSAFSVLVAKLAGVRVVCIDHGNLTLLKNPSYRAERIAALATKNWSFPRQLWGRLCYIGYWPSLSLLARISARFVDHYLIPGVAGDGTEEICKRLGISSSRFTRFGSMIDAHRYLDLDGNQKRLLRAKLNIPADSIVIAMTCRLAAEKGIHIALNGISQTLSELSQEVRRRVKVIIAGDGPLRPQIEEDIHTRQLDHTYTLWGETSPSDVVSLLGIADIFLYTSIRGACLSMAVLEAMASACAVIASTRPLSNEKLLAEGRGIAVPAENVEQTSNALTRLINDAELCLNMGRAARHYVEQQHNATVFKRVLTRAIGTAEQTSQE